MDRPVPWGVSDIPTIWVDHATGVGVNDDGNSVKPRISGRRKTPSLADLLDTAAIHNASRIMLTGAVPATVPGKPHWLHVATPGWRPLPHWIAEVDPVGRFVSETGGKRVEIHLARAWFRELELSPDQARQALASTQSRLRKSFRQYGSLLKTPAGTGANLWAASLPATTPVPLMDDEAAELIHAVNGQHRVEHLVPGPAACPCGGCLTFIDDTVKTIPTFTYIDGRFMYSSLCRELGIGNPERLTAAQATELFESDRYARGLLHVRFTVPDWLPPHVGLLPMQHDNPSDGWHYPSAPGFQGETWADSAEIFTAQMNGWDVEILEALHYPRRYEDKRARPLDTWADRLKVARQPLPGEDPIISKAVAAAMRAILIQGIGAFASRGRSEQASATSYAQIPPACRESAQKLGDLFIYRLPAKPMDERQRQFYRPELATQVWGRGRARVCEAPTGLSNVGGLVQLEPEDILGINGDAIYLRTPPPDWACPDAANGGNHLGGDDGREGRLRVQGVLSGRMRIPRTTEERNRLRAKAANAGYTPGSPTPVTDKEQ